MAEVKQHSKENHFYLLAIVGIVAIVGLFFMMKDNSYNMNIGESSYTIAESKQCG